MALNWVRTIFSHREWTIKCRLLVWKNHQQLPSSFFLLFGAWSPFSFAFKPSVHFTFVNLWAGHITISPYTLVCYWLWFRFSSLLSLNTHSICSPNLLPLLSLPPHSWRVFRPSLFPILVTLVNKLLYYAAKPLTNYLVARDMSFDNWGGISSLANFDNFYGESNFCGTIQSQTIVEQQSEVVCHSESIEIIQQRLLVLQEMAKR